MLVKIVIWLLNKLFDSKKRSLLEPCIKELYRRMAKDELKIKSEIVKVKKGKRRYDLVFFDMPDGKMKVNLGRHWEENEVNKEIIFN